MRGVQGGQQVDGKHPLPGLAVAVGNGREGKTARDIDQRVELPEMRSRRVDCFLGLCRVGEIDAAELDPFRRRRSLGRRVIQGRNACAPRQGLFRDDPPECSLRARDRQDFPVPLPFSLIVRFWLKFSGPL